jgi:hypothetical protein
MEMIKFFLGLFLVRCSLAQAEKWKAVDALPIDEVQISVTLIDSVASFVKYTSQDPPDKKIDVILSIIVEQQRAISDQQKAISEQNAKISNLEVRRFRVPVSFI